MEPDIGINLSVFLGSLINTAPAMAIWIVALILSIILLKRGGGRIERFLIAGSSLMLLSTLLKIPVPVIISFLSHENGLSNVNKALITSVSNLFLGLISLAGIICLFYAIWKKFNDKMMFVK